MSLVLETSLFLEQNLFYNASNISLYHDSYDQCSNQEVKQFTELLSNLSGTEGHCTYSHNILKSYCLKQFFTLSSYIYIYFFLVWLFMGQIVSNNIVCSFHPGSVLVVIMLWLHLFDYKPKTYIYTARFPRSFQSNTSLVIQEHTI